jgi:mono/diheme cytochrome c family protein
MRSIRRRTALLISVAILAFGGVACGRATEEQINQLLGITPTATLSAAEIASATAAARATSTARALAASSPGAAALGDVASGERQFETWCAGCHGPGGVGPDIRAPGSAGATISADALASLIREGTDHQPPGPYKTTEISDKQIVDIAAYLRQEAGG